MHVRITDDLDALLDILPPTISQPLKEKKGGSELLEVVLDLGRLPEARYPEEEVALRSQEVTEDDLKYVVSRIGSFTSDNRAGMERTLHRISAIRNRQGKIVGLTCRIGRAVYGTIKIIEDLIQKGGNLLLLGKPGVGKTTMLREVARVLADEMKKRVIVVDTSNEIGGDGDIPHPAIGRARRMQVPTPSMQHAVMIEAVENHMPEVIIIDEIGTELEAAAARTIAERGVQLIATAHGNTLDNLLMNPTLSDLVGGVQTVTLSDEEARRRGTQKSILERKAPPTFSVVVEIQSWYKVAVHANVAEVVDSWLRGHPIPPEVRWLDEEGKIGKIGKIRERAPLSPYKEPIPSTGDKAIRIYSYGVSRGLLEKAQRELGFPVEIVNDLQKATVLLTLKAYYRRHPQPIKAAEALGVPIYVLRKNSLPQIEQCLADISGTSRPDKVEKALEEAQAAAAKIASGEGEVPLSPQSSYIRRLQHQLAERYHLASRSQGREPHRSVVIFAADLPQG